MNAGRRLLPARSLRNRLAGAFFLITLLAIGIVYFYVAPSLTSSLLGQRLTTLAGAADAYSGPLARSVGSTEDANAVARDVRLAAGLAGARVTLLGVSTAEINGAPGLSTYYIFDSSAAAPEATGGGDLQFAIAADAVRSGHTVTGTEVGTGGRVGEAAKSLSYRGRPAEVVVFSEPLNDISRSGALIRNRILISGAVAMALALLAGFGVSRALSGRIKRLEQTARRVARGDFTARFPVDSEDELGQLALTLDSMQGQLAELDSARERFIATASHELRTPIFSLGGFLELLQDEDLDDETRRLFLTQVRDQVERLGKLATGLLDLSRLEAGGLELHTETAVDVSAVARQVAQEFIPALGQHSSHLRLRLLREPLGARCDPERVAQVMRILIDNALTHTPARTDVVVTVAPTEETGVRVTVRDYGPGVPRADMDRIFEPFYTSNGVQGSGLGLAIARELAERMGGRLAATSTPGRTLFTLDLPA